LPIDFLLAARKADELLRALGTYRDYQPSADRQLLQQGFGNSERSGRHKNGIERRVRLPTCCAVPMPKPYVANLKLFDPLLRTLQNSKSAMGAFVLIALAWLIVAGYTSINAVVKAELFPTAVRATGVGLPFAITTSIFGGPAESIALWFKSIGHEVWFSYYLSCVIGISLIVSLLMRDTKRYSTLGNG